MSRLPLSKAENNLPVKAVALMLERGSGVASILDRYPTLDRSYISSIYIYDSAVPKPYAEFVSPQEVTKVARIITTAVDVFEANHSTVNEWFKSTPLQGIGKTAAVLVSENKADLVLG